MNDVLFIEIDGNVSLACPNPTSVLHIKPGSVLADKITACIWAEDEDGGCWTPSCGGEWFALNEGTPSENGMKFCCYCGKPLLTEDGIRKEECRNGKERR